MPENANAFDTPITQRIPWAKASLNSDIPLNLDYDDCSMVEAIEEVAKKYPNNIAFDFMGRSTTYR